MDPVTALKKCEISAVFRPILSANTDSCTDSTISYSRRSLPARATFFQQTALPDLAAKTTEKGQTRRKAGTQSYRSKGLPMTAELPVNVEACCAFRTVRLGVAVFAKPVRQRFAHLRSSAPVSPREFMSTAPIMNRITACMFLIRGTYPQSVG